MFLDLSQQSADNLARSTVKLQAGQTGFWPAEQPIREIADPRIVGTRFQDANLLHPPLLAQLLTEAAKQPPNVIGWGGVKVRDAATWNLPELKLLTNRALMLLCRSRKVTAAHVLDRWANVIERGDYSQPHCHFEAESAVVYFLDTGDENSGGEFELIDSRIPFCCSRRAEYPNRGIFPAMVPGTMLLFPASFLHFVKPYTGLRPRITLAWNLNSGLPPQDAHIDPTQLVPGIIQNF
jgi:Putative 2OG-Fe(II) oxygenase